MAATIATPFSSSIYRRPPRNSVAIARAMKSGEEDLSRRREDVVIVGAGIAGLATAVSLKRLGIRSVVLEQADSLRTGGTSLTLFKNGWKVLDAIGVADDLRPQFLEIQGMVVKSQDGKQLRSFRFKDEDQSQEVRAVERGILLETLANQLPPESIRFSSKLAKIETKDNAGSTLLQLTDGTEVLANIVVACDGIRSPVANWMGFPEAKYSGHCAFRGLGVYENGHPFEPKVNYVYGRGIRAGYVPVSETKVYWFVCFNSPSLGPRITDPSELKKQAKDLVKSWPSELQNLIDITPGETLSRTPLVDRWLWPVITPPPSKRRHSSRRGRLAPHDPEPRTRWVLCIRGLYRPSAKARCCNEVRPANILFFFFRSRGTSLQIVWGREMASCISIDSSGECGWIAVAVGESCGLCSQERCCDS